MTNSPKYRLVREVVKWIITIFIVLVGAVVFKDYVLVVTAKLGLALPAKVLIAVGADPGRCTSGGENALTMAVLEDHYDVVEVIVESDYSIESRDARGKTPLQLATEMERGEIRRLLIAAKNQGRDRRPPSGCSIDESGGHSPKQRDQ